MTDGINIEFSGAPGVQVIQPGHTTLQSVLRARLGYSLIETYLNNGTFQITDPGESGGWAMKFRALLHTVPRDENSREWRELKDVIERVRNAIVIIPPTPQESSGVLQFPRDGWDDRKWVAYATPHNIRVCCRKYALDMLFIEMTAPIRNQKLPELYDIGIVGVGDLNNGTLRRPGLNYKFGDVFITCYITQQPAKMAMRHYAYAEYLVAEQLERVLTLIKSQGFADLTPADRHAMAALMIATYGGVDRSKLGISSPERAWTDLMNNALKYLALPYSKGYAALTRALADEVSQGNFELLKEMLVLNIFLSMAAELQGAMTCEVTGMWRRQNIHNAFAFLQLHAKHRYHIGSSDGDFFLPQSHNGMHNIPVILSIFEDTAKFVNVYEPIQDEELVCEAVTLINGEVTNEMMPKEEKRYLLGVSRDGRVFTRQAFDDTLIGIHIPIGESIDTGDESSYFWYHAFLADATVHGSVYTPLKLAESVVVQIITGFTYEQLMDMYEGKTMLPLPSPGMPAGTIEKRDQVKAEFDKAGAKNQTGVEGKDLEFKDTATGESTTGPDTSKTEVSGANKGGPTSGKPPAGKSK